MITFEFFGILFITEFLVFFTSFQAAFDFNLSLNRPLKINVSNRILWAVAVWYYKWKFLKFSKSSLLKVNCSVVILLNFSPFLHAVQYSSLSVQHLKKCHFEKVSLKQRLSLDMLSSLMCKMILLFCWLLYRDRFKCLGGTPIHPHVQHSPMASSPFPVPKKNMSLWTLTPPWSTSTLHQEAKHMPEQLTPALPSI